MQAHAPKHHGGSIEYLERHLLAVLLTLALMAAAILAAIAITNATDDAETIAVPDVVAPSSGDIIRYLEQNTELPPYTGAAEQSSITSYSQPGMGEGWVGGAGRPAVTLPPSTRDYSLDWARFLEANGVTGALTDPVTSEDMLFLEQNLYLPSGDTGVEDVTGQRDISAYYEAAMGEGWLANGKPVTDDRTPGGRGPERNR